MKQNNNKRKLIPMTSTVILATLITITCCLNSFTQAARVIDREASDLRETITTELPPASYIEDPANSATTSDSGEDDICFRCYDEVKMAQNLIAIQLDLVDKQSKLIRQKNKAAAAAAAAASSSTSPPNTTPLSAATRKLKQRQQRGENSTTGQTGQITTTSSTRIRSLENQPIVVSRLRVARSADQRSSGQLDLVRGGLGVNVANRNGPKTTKDPALKQLKHKQEQQLNETCKSLYEVQQCLNGISRECLGNLQFHSQEVYLKQWLGKLNCPPINDPNLRPYKWITRTIPRIQEPEKVPIPRPISSQEEIQKKLDAIFGGRNRSPFGVILKPTLTRSASQKFNSLSEQSGQLQQQLPLDGSANGYSTKGHHLLNHQQIMAPVIDEQPESQLLAMTSQLLLVPAFLILVVLFVTLASRYIKQTKV